MNARWTRTLRLLFWLGLMALVSLPQLCFWQDSTDPFAPVELALVKTLLPLALLPWLWQSRLDWAALLRRWPARLLLGWAAWLWVCALASPSRAGGLKTALEYNLYASVFFLPAALAQTQRRRLMAALAGASLLASVYALVQHFGGDPWRWSTEFNGRPLGTIGNPDFFAGHLVLAWGLCLGWLLAAPAGRRRWPAAAFALITWAQLYSRVAGAWLGMLLALACAAALLLLPAGERLRRAWGWSRRGVALSLAALAVAAALGLSVGPGRRAWEQFRQEKSVSVVNRTMMWRVALNLWREHPLQGAGLDSYRTQYPQLQSEILASEPKAGWNYVVTWLPHENFLYLLCETGALGLLLFLGLWAGAAWSAWRRAADGERAAPALLLALAGLAGIALLNTFSNIPPTALGFFLCAGMAVWPARTDAEAAADAARPWALEPLVAAAVVALLVAVPAGRELVANRYTREAGRADKRGDFGLAAQLNSRAIGLGVARLTPQSLVGVQYSLAEDLRQSAQAQPDPAQFQALMQAAVQAYQADLAENPWAPEDHNMLGAALGQLGSAARRADWLQQSAQHLELAAHLSPGYGSALLNLGGSRMMLGDVSG
ncbi:MAG TPA: O-antigen ligase family protein, partial [bacterium]|nr:O-antigen ligase family protein [bacterium]